MQTTSIEVGEDLTSISIYLDANTAPFGPNYMTSVRIEGTGTCPFGTPNCLA
jgi:hypothetical protein